jgi:hypothetical protein
MGSILVFFESLIICTAILISRVSAQSNSHDVVWSHTFGSPAADMAYSVKQTMDGGYIMAGFTEPHGTHTPGCCLRIPILIDLFEATGKSYMEDLWVVKTDSEGRKIWDKIFERNGADIAYSIEQTQNGGYIIAGETGRIGDSSGDAWLIKIDGEGRKVFDHTFNGGAGDGFRSVKQTSDGGYILAGWTGAGATSAGGDAWLVRTDSLGQKLWDQKFGSDQADDAAYSVQQTQDGGYILAGVTGISGFLSGDASIIKTDEEGKKIWELIFGKKENFDIALCVQQTLDGGYVVAGLKDGKINFVGGDAWLAKIDGDGKTMWEQTFGSKDGGATAVQQTFDGGYIIGCWTRSHPTSKTKGYDCWLIKTNAEGTTQWDLLFGGKKTDGIWSVCQTLDEGYILAGWTKSQGAGREDALLIKVGKTKKEFTPNKTSVLRIEDTYSYNASFNPDNSALSLVSDGSKKK